MLYVATAAFTLMILGAIVLGRIFPGKQTAIPHLILASLLWVMSVTSDLMTQRLVYEVLAVTATAYGVPSVYRLMSPRCRFRLGARSLMKTVSAPPIPAFGESKVAVHIGDNIGEKYVSEVRAACKMARKRNCLLEVTIDSKGGLVREGEVICDLLRKHAQNHPVRGVVVGNCHSMAIPILLALPLGCRYGRRSASFMTHCAKSSLNGERNDSSRSDDRRLSAAIVGGSQALVKDIETIMNKGFDYTFDAREAFRLGFIGRIV